MKRNMWMIPDLILAAVYFLVFLSLTGLNPPAPGWVSLGFVLLSHAALWIWMGIQPRDPHRITHLWVIGGPCALHILIASTLSAVFTAFSLPMKPVLVSHSILMLLFIGICFILHQGNMDDAEASAARISDVRRGN